MMQLKIILLIVTSGVLANAWSEETVLSKENDFSVEHILTDDSFPLDENVLSTEHAKSDENSWSAENNVNSEDDEMYYSSDAFINLVNSKSETWQAGRNFPTNTSVKDFRKLTGQIVETDEEFILPEFFHDFASAGNIPTSFDARDHWSNCPTVREIRDQGPCGSCWAVAAAETMSDRVCIHSGGRVHFRFSSEDLLACCSFCGRGCKGGNSGRAFLYWVNVGIVSGGAYKSHAGCRPYTMPPCEHHVNGHRLSCARLHGTTPQCIQECQPGYSVPYMQDRNRGKMAYRLPPNVQSIQMDIMKHGPVEAAFTVYSDFMTYKSGVYQHVAGKFLAYHAVRILGWGVENGVDYWLIANSWNTDWGDKGFFKFIRGINHLHIESMIVAGIPAR